MAPPKRWRVPLRTIGLRLAFCLFALTVRGAEATDNGWQAGWPRDELKPLFQYDPKGGPHAAGLWAIEAGPQEGALGYWTKTVPVHGGQTYHFAILRRALGTDSPRRTAVVQLFWSNDRGEAVPYGQPGSITYDHGIPPPAEPEYPQDLATDARGWTEVAGTYPAPPLATRATVKLQFRWAPRARVEWTDLALTEVPAPPPRIVRLAAVHYRPEAGSTPKEKREQFAPFIAEAGRQKADLVVLPETLTIYSDHPNYVAGAEPIPGGPSVEYFGQLARKYNLYIVAGLVERDGHLIYNTAALVGPDGNFIGKYRKTTLPRGEVDAGVEPGHEYPVYQTRFGRVGMMICYDGFFPEVARQLADHGAEVIAWPVWGCLHLLGSARAWENHVYIVGSTYDNLPDRTITGVFDHEGQIIARTSKFGTIAIAQVDLNFRTHWHTLGDYQAELLRSRPVWMAGPAE